MGSLAPVGPLTGDRIGPLGASEPRSGGDRYPQSWRRPQPITLDRTSDVPLYRQVEDQLRTAIHEGRLQPGARLPGIRTLAADLGVARVTIATAYEQLTAEGYLVGRVGSGTTVAPDPPGRPPTVPTAPPTPGAAGIPGPAVRPAARRRSR